MKKIYLAALLVALTLGSCGTKVTSPYTDSAVISHPTQGAVVLRGIGEEVDGKKKELELKARRAAQKKAIQQLLYFGFVGTDFKNPIIKEGISVETKHKTFFDKFWNGEYERFITDGKTEFYTCKNKSNCSSAVSVFTLNYNMLRKELESNKIINKIGF